MIEFHYVRLGQVISIVMGRFELSHTDTDTDADTASP